MWKFNILRISLTTTCIYVSLVFHRALPRAVLEFPISFSPPASLAAEPKV